jgi:type II secretory pathway pseudopilin PulG
MLTSSPPLSPRARDERGFTLIEMMVSMSAGVFVIGGLVAILAVSLHQNARIGDRVQSDRLGRTALNKVVEELRSACTGFTSSAIQAPSTTPTTPLASTGPLNLWFLTAYGSPSSGEAAIKSVTEHDVVWTSTGTSNTGEALGKLTDYSWNSTGGEPPNSPWTFNATLSTATASKARVLATNVIPAETSTLFRYERYDTTATDAAYGELIPMAASELPPTTTSAKKIANVAIAFRQAPERGDTRPGHTTSFSSGVALRLTPTESSAEGSTCA